MHARVNAEATSALDEATESALYDVLEAPAMVSVSHRPGLRRFHTHVLRREDLEDAMCCSTWPP